mmetsp:Transcript_50982/g.114707  ORF Transcript_50982/g.114707 Transcript_50982/m.114707 type:complete len:231 (+) Transcript_50982:44-736(+)
MAALAAKRWLGRTVIGCDTVRSLQASRRWIAIDYETTPNPRSMKFIPEGKAVLGDGAKSTVFRSVVEAGTAPLAVNLLGIDGVREVMLAPHHVTVTKSAVADWDELRPAVETSMSDFYEAGQEVMAESSIVRHSLEANPESVEGRIMEVLEVRVKPYVEQDGGDVEFERFDEKDGTLYLMMKGSCAGCSQSHVTLQDGVRNLMEHYVPEVKNIVGLMEEVEEIPRPGRGS